MNHKWSSITTFRHRNQAITHIRGCHEDSNQYTPCKRKPDNTTYAQSLRAYVRLPFAKSLWDQNCSSTLGIKSWLHSDRPAITVILGYHILPPTTAKEYRLQFDQAVTEATRFTGHHKSCMRQYIINACSTGPNMMQSLIDIGEGYNWGASNLTSDHSHPSHTIFFTSDPYFPRLVLD
jgi:hypothetical protein